MRARCPWTKRRVSVIRVQHAFVTYLHENASADDWSASPAGTPRVRPWRLACGSLPHDGLPECLQTPSARLGGARSTVEKSEPALHAALRCDPAGTSLCQRSAHAPHLASRRSFGAVPGSPALRVSSATVAACNAHPVDADGSGTGIIWALTKATAGRVGRCRRPRCGTKGPRSSRCARSPGRSSHATPTGGMCCRGEDVRGADSATRHVAWRRYCPLRIFCFCD